MLSFQSPHMLFIAFIAIWSTQFAFTLSQTSTIKCTLAFGITSQPQFAACRDDTAAWVCPTASCQRDGHRFAPMKNCVIGNGNAVDQECTRYTFKRNDHYICTNSGLSTYSCPYTPETVPYITCKECSKAK